MSEQKITINLDASKLCACPPEPKPKHDGNLSSDGGRVSYDWLMEQGIRIEGHYYDGYNGVIVLMPSEALSLLAWLEQERETLEQMAKEQEDGPRKA